MKCFDESTNIDIEHIDVVAKGMKAGKITKILVEKAGVPIVVPSANLSGKLSGTKISDIIEDFSD